MARAPSALLYYFRTKAEFYSRILERIALLGIFVMGLLLTPDASLVDLILCDRPEAYRELYKALMANPNDNELREELKELE